MSEHPLQLNAAYSVCRHIARSAAKNFYYGFLVLPKPKRNALSAVYAFMRRADDISDDAAIEPQQRRKKLEEWLDALRRVVAGERTDDPVLFALADAQKRYKIPLELLETLVQGTEMDVPEQGQGTKAGTGGAPQLQYETFDQLYDYCYHVASVVGLICIRIFGYRDPRAEELAEHTGVAFQLTNIIRDVHDDYALGRVYIPQEDLERYNVVHEDFSRREATLGVRELLRFEADRAWQNYKEGAGLLGLISPESRGTLWLLTHTYSALLARIESLDFAVFGERVRLSRAEKMLFIAQARFGRVTEENILEKCDRDRRRSGGTRGRRRAS